MRATPDPPSRPRWPLLLVVLSGMGAMHPLGYIPFLTETEPEPEPEPPMPETTEIRE